MIRKCYLLNEQANRRWILDLVGWLLAWCGQRDVYLPNVRTERTTNILVLERAGIVGVNVVLRTISAFDSSLTLHTYESHCNSATEHYEQPHRNVASGSLNQCKKRLIRNRSGLAHRQAPLMRWVYQNGVLEKLPLHVSMNQC